MKLLLIDGHYYVYRSFFAIPSLSNSRGEPTNAILGFTKTVRRMLKDLQPEMGAVFWDEGLPQKRVELQPAYKETRKEMPLPMIPQLDFIRDLTPLMGFKNISLPNTEADDLMGCYAIAAARRGYEVILATNDKDLFQLVNDKVKVYTTAKADLASPKDTYALLGEAEVSREMGRAAGADWRCSRDRGRFSGQHPGRGHRPESRRGPDPGTRRTRFASEQHPSREEPPQS